MSIHLFDARHCLRPDVSPDVFMPEKSRPATEARRLCLGSRDGSSPPCPGLADCLRDVIAGPKTDGIYAGTNENQRRLIKRLVRVGVPLEAIDLRALPPHTRTLASRQYLAQVYGQFGATVDNVAPGFRPDPEMRVAA